MSEKQTKISISSTIEEIDTAVRAAVDFAESIGVSEDAIFGIDMAVREVVANAVKHGNKLSKEKPVDLIFEDAAEGFRVSVRDYGEGFDVSEVPDPTDPENLLKENGRGILFMNTFMDKVEWLKADGGGTLVKMIKNR